MKHLIPINNADSGIPRFWGSFAIVETILIESIKAGFCDLTVMKHLIPIKDADN